MFVEINNSFDTVLRKNRALVKTRFKYIFVKLFSIKRRKVASVAEIRATSQMMVKKVHRTVMKRALIVQEATKTTHPGNGPTECLKIMVKAYHSLSMFYAWTNIRTKNRHTLKCEPFMDPGI